MSSFEKIAVLLADIFDCSTSDIQPATRIMGDLGGESVDLLEIAVRINADFGIPVNEDRIFLRNLRYLMAECSAQGTDPALSLAREYPHLSEQRCTDLAHALSTGDTAPLLNVSDLVAYVDSLYQPTA